MYTKIVNWITKTQADIVNQKKKKKSDFTINLNTHTHTQLYKKTKTWLIKQHTMCWIKKHQKGGYKDLWDGSIKKQRTKKN